MTRVSNAAAVEIQCWFRIAQAKKTAKALYVRHEEERSLSATRIQSLVRSSIVRRRVERIVSSTITIQCLFRVTIANKRAKETIQANLNLNSSKEEPFWISCSKVVTLVGVVTVVLCFLIHSIFIYGYSISQMKEASDPSFLESAKGAVKTGVLRSDDINEFSRRMRIVQNKSDIMDDVLSEQRRVEGIVLIEEDDSNDFLEKVVISVSQEKLNFDTLIERTIVEVSQKSNVSISIENATYFTGSQLISEWKDMLMGNEIVPFASDDGSSMYDMMMISPVLIEQHPVTDDTSVDHSEIVKVFAEQFRMEHILSVPNLDSYYI